MKAYATATAQTIDSSARARFDELEQRLRGPEVMEMEAEALESLIESEGREVMRRLLEEHLELRHVREPERASIIGADDIARTHHRERQRHLGSIFGEVSLVRDSVGGRGVRSLLPLDGELNLPAHTFSPGVERRVAEAAAQGSFDQTVEAMLKTTGAGVAKRQTETLAVEAGRDFVDFYETRKAKGKEPGQIMALLFDGKGIRMIDRDLREGTRKAAQKAAQNRTGQPSISAAPDEKVWRKRMAEVAAVYTIEPFVRTPEDVVRELRPVHGVPLVRPRPQNKRVWASVEREMKDVVEEAFQEGLLRDPQRKKRWVALVDGNLTQLALVQETARKHQIDLTIVVDVIHVLTYLWAAAHALCGTKSQVADEWIREHLLHVLHGEASLVAGGMRRSATKRGMSAKKREPIDKAADYLLKYQQFLKYDRHLEAGLPISTGVIEGACRHLVQDRLGITGARWSVAGAEAVLKLRALRSSGDFEEYWRFHRQRQLERNHLAHYANRKLPASGPALRLVK